MKVIIYYDKVTPVSGSVSFNTPHLYGRLVGVHIKPTTASTQWHFQVINPKSFYAYESLNVEEGELNQAIDCVLLNGVYTCSITGATVDEDFAIQFDVEGNQ
jgi:hypothetical protein